jgi:hypothetical protein
MGTKFVLSLLGLLAVCIGLPSYIAYRRARRHREDLAHAAEVALHWPDLDPSRVSSKSGLPAPGGEAVALNPIIGRVVDMQLMARGGVMPLDIRCSHPRYKYPRVIMLYVERVAVGDDIPACSECVSAFLLEHGIACAACKKLLFPGDDVAIAEAGSAVQTAYEHLRLGCCDDVSRYCGVWGKGRLISLHELYPGAFPDQDGRTVTQGTFSSRRREPGSA